MFNINDLLGMTNKNTTSDHAENDTEKNKSNVKIGVGAALDLSVRNSTAKANVKFNKPKYNPETRKKYYDDGSAHKRAIDNAFDGKKTIKDPYTGSDLYKSQKEAKLNKGMEWQNHAAEADHIDPLVQITDRNKNNPFLTTEDIKKVANRDGNFQIISKTNNQNSKEVGKGGSTQKEWAEDDVRMQGLADLNEDGRSKQQIKDQVKRVGEESQKENDKQLKKIASKNMRKTAHDAGKDAATQSGVTALTMSGIMNMVSVVKGEKSGTEAVEDTIKDAGKAAVTSYAMGGGMTVVAQKLSYSSSEFMRSLARNNVPGKILTAVTVTGDTLKKWGTGEITTQECLIELGNKGLNMVTAGYSMAIGQALIPIPIIGGAIGALVGGMLTSSYYNSLVNDLKTKQLEHEERIRIINECRMAVEKTRKFRAELEDYLNNYFEDCRSCFESAMSSMDVAYEMGDADGVIASANDITRKLGGRVKFDSVDEFKNFLDSDEVDIF